MNELQKLFEVLVDQGIITTPFNDFVEKYQDPVYQEQVYDIVFQDGLYTKDKESFVKKYSVKTDDGLSETPEIVPSNEMVGIEEEEREPNTSVFVDAGRKIKANTLTAIGQLARIPTTINEQIFTGVLGLTNPEALEKINALPREEREKIINAPSMAMYEGLGSLGGGRAIGTGINTQAGADLYNEYNKESKEIQDTYIKYDQSITEDLAGIQDLDLDSVARGVSRISIEALGSLPSLVQAMVPLAGIGSIIAGSIAGKSADLQDEGDDLNYKTSLNSIISGTAEGVFEIVTKKIGGRFYKSLLNKGVDATLKTISDMALRVSKDFTMEGLSEDATLLVQKMSDYVLNDDEDAFKNSFSEFLETFLIGGVATGPLSVGSVGINRIRQNRRGNKIKKIVNESSYKDFSSTFSDPTTDPINETQLDILNVPQSKQFLERTLDLKVAKNEITTEQKNNILNNFDKKAALAFELDGLNIQKKDQLPALKLLTEKKALESQIAGKDESLVKAQRNRIQEINIKLEEISERSGAETTIKELTKDDAVKALLEEGVETPSDQQIIKKLDELNKTQQNEPIQKPGPEGVPVQKSPEDSQEVGRRDDQSTEPTQKTAQEKETVKPAQEGQEKVEEEVVYTLPEDPKEARKDFEIIDNRDGSTTNISEDGTGKWIVVNKKTGLLIETSTKKDAEVLAKNPKNNWDYGEGETYTIEQKKSTPIKPLTKTQTKTKKKKRKQAQKNINSKIGSAKDLGPVLEELFSVDNSLIPDDKVSTYDNLLEVFGERAKVLTLPEAGKVMVEAQDILSNLKEEAVKEKKPRTKKEKTPPVIKNIVKNKVDTSQVPKGPSRDLANYLNNLSEKDINRLVKEKDGKQDYSEVNNLIKVLNNISKGYDQTNQAGELQRIIEGSKSAERMLNSVSKINFNKLAQGIERSLAKLKASFTKNSKIFEQVRTAPLIYMDEALGNFNKSALVKETILPIASAYSKFESQFLKKVAGPLGKAINLLEQGKGKVTRRTRRKAIEGSVKIYTYQLAREYKSNPNRKDVYKALDYINETIKYLEENKFSRIFGKQKIEILKQIKNDFTVDGEIDSDKLYESLTNKEKEAERLSSEVNASLASEALYTSQLRGNRLDQYVNYVHHQVLRNDNANQKILETKKEKFVKPSTKAGVIEKRTKGVKPLNFDFISASQNAAKDLLLDYHMTQPLRVVRKSLDNLKQNSKNNPKISEEQKEIVSAIDSAFDEVIQKVFGSTYSNNNSPIFNFIKTTSYQSALASIPRSVDEVLSNLNHILFANPAGFIRGIKNYGKSLIKGDIDYSGFLESIGSINTLKLVRKSTLTSKFADNTMFTTDEVKSLDEMGPVTEAMNYIYQNSLGIPVRNLYKVTDKIASGLMSGPDMVLAAPLYVDTFIQTFKKETGITLTIKDINEIGNGTSKYLETYKDAIKESRIKADQENTTFSTSASPFAGPLKSKLDPKETNTLKKIVNLGNYFMTNFRFFEFANSQRAVRALFFNGDISRLEATGILTGNVVRMTTYMAIYDLVFQSFDSGMSNLTGLDVEPEKDDEDPKDINRLYRAFVGTAVALILQRSTGNLASFAIAGMIEYLNERFGGALRDEREYDSFNDNVTFNPVRFDKLLGNDLIDQTVLAVAGPYSYPIKSAARFTKVVTGMQKSKKESTREKYKEEFYKRILPQVAQNLRLLPFSKDIIRPLVKDLFKEEAPKPEIRKWTIEDYNNAKDDPGLREYIREQIQKQKSFKR